jgi:4-coumarate--CoA ligase
MCQGGAAVLMRKFDLKMFKLALSKHRATLLPMVPPVLLLLAKNPIFDDFDFSVRRFQDR